MNLETGGRPHIILTGDHSTASVCVGDGPEIITLRANSLLYVDKPRPCVLKRASKNIKLLAGKAWAHLIEWAGKSDWEEPQGNAVTGVRG